ncbi:uncharacterized protein EAF02_004339 [Botrytis sinoallii]|uniref:uncharacterized protein n=1 Tax=Botrytis sinoallii TaxID=1463999 RepID=UPI0019003658|nr:uncharacterized protein EAF02_004339 [Botrytis sinoallii]KAF7885830.1 hypothetical protein EAF02_004339 [Botrytis sinoallii]
MSESESDVSNPLYNRAHEDYLFYGRELIPHFPYRAYHLNILRYPLPNGRFEQDNHLPAFFLYRLRKMFPEVITTVFSHIIEEPSIDPAVETDIEGSSFIPDLVLLSRRVHGHPVSDDEGGGGPITSYPIPITALLFREETQAIYTPTTGVDSQAWKIQNTKDWRDHRSTQRILERSVCSNPSEGTYSQLVQFAYSLALHEKFQIGYDSCMWWSPLVRKHSLLKQFLRWFWSHFGLYINTCNWNWYPKVMIPKFFSVYNLLQYHRLEHLTLRFSTKTINLKDGDMHMNMRQFIDSLSDKRCGVKGCKGNICGKKYCGDHSWFPNLRNITYLNRNHHTEGTAEARCDPMRTGWSRRLVKYFQDVKLSKSIEVIFDVYGDADEESCDSDGESGSDWNEDLYKNYDPKDYHYESNDTDTPVLLHNRQLAVQDCIRRLLMPNSLLKGNTDDLPEDLGLQELFQDTDI